MGYVDGQNVYSGYFAMYQGLDPYGFRLSVEEVDSLLMRLCKETCKAIPKAVSCVATGGMSGVADIAGKTAVSAATTQLEFLVNKCNLGKKAAVSYVMSNGMDDKEYDDSWQKVAIDTSGKLCDLAGKCMSQKLAGEGIAKFTKGQIIGYATNKACDTACEKGVKKTSGYSTLIGNITIIDVALSSTEVHTDARSTEEQMQEAWAKNEYTHRGPIPSSNLLYSERCFKLYPRDSFRRTLCYAKSKGKTSNEACKSKCNIRNPGNGVGFTNCLKACRSMYVSVRKY